LEGRRVHRHLHWLDGDGDVVLFDVVLTVGMHVYWLSCACFETRGTDLGFVVLFPFFGGVVGVVVGVVGPVLVVLDRVVQVLDETGDSGKTVVLVV
jgi:hypothetical protein